MFFLVRQTLILPRSIFSPPFHQQDIRSIETLVTPWQKPWQIRCENRLLAGGPKKVGGWVARLLVHIVWAKKNYIYLKCRKDLVIQRRVKKERQKEIWNYLQKKEISVEICIKKIILFWMFYSNNLSIIIFTSDYI